METNPIASTRPLLIKLLLDFMFYALLFNSTKSFRRFAAVFKPTEPIETEAPGPRHENDNPALETEAVVQPVAINAPIWSNGQHES